MPSHTPAERAKRRRTLLTGAPPSIASALAARALPTGGVEEPKTRFLKSKRKLPK